MVFRQKRDMAPDAINQGPPPRSDQNGTANRRQSARSDRKDAALRAHTVAPYWRQQYGPSRGSFRGNCPIGGTNMSRVIAVMACGFILTGCSSSWMPSIDMPSFGGSSGAQS